MINTTCFGTNYIGIRGECDGETPTSGLYINDLPGVTLKLAASLATEESIQGITVLRRYEQQAIQSVWVDVQSKLETVVVGQVIETRQIGLHRNDLTTIQYLPLQAANVGLLINKSDCDPYTNLQINYVDIRSNSTVANKVLTLTDGSIVKTFTYDSVAGLVQRIYIGYEAVTGSVLLTVDASDLLLEDMSIGNGCSCSNSCKCSEYGCLLVYGWNGAERAYNANGMTVNASCVCSGSQILCSLKGALGILVQMKIGILLMMDLLTSKRSNYYVQNSKEDAQNLLLFWNGGINQATGMEYKSEYWRTVGMVAGAIKGSLMNNSKCVKCTGTKIVTKIP